MVLGSTLPQGRHPVLHHFQGVKLLLQRTAPLGVCMIYFSSPKALGRRAGHSSCILRHIEEGSEYCKTCGKVAEPRTQKFDSKCLPQESWKNLDSVVCSWIHLLPPSPDPA